MTIDSTAVDPIGASLRRAYERRASHLAVRDPRRDLTYGGLRERSTRLVRGLHSLGVRAGDRIILIAPNGCEWVEIDHACFLGGFGRAALLSRLHPSELGAIARDADPSVVFADAAWLASAGREWIPETIRHLVVVGDGDGREALAYEDVVAAGRAEELPPIDPEALAWLMYTSGSTGLPKGVIHTQRTLGAMVRNILAEMPMASEDQVALHTAPLSHFSGAIGLALSTLGATNLCHPSFELGPLIETVSSGSVQILPLVPTQIVMLVDEVRRRRQAGDAPSFRHVELIPYAGSAIAPDRLVLARELFGPVLLQFYGSTEAPMPLTALQPDEHTDERDEGGLPRLASAGNPNRHVELRVIGPNGESLGPGQPGEIVVRGDQVCRGYWRNPEATDEVLRDGWLATGDVGYLDRKGFLFIVDRKKDMIVTGGFNVYPREVENVISTLSGVREVAVVAAPSDRWGEQIIAVISCTENAELTADDVIRHCRGRLGGYKVPKRVRFVNELPKSGAGKILKRAIRDELWTGRDRRV